MAPEPQRSNKQSKPLWLKERNGRYENREKTFRTPTFSAEKTTALGREILSFSAWMKPTEEESLLRESFCGHTKDIIVGLWPQVDVSVFGSTATGLVLPTSDIDMVVEGLCDPSSDDFNDLADALVEAGMTEIQVLSFSKVPLVKFLDPHTMLCGDISFGVSLAAASVPLVLTYLEQYPAARPLILVLKTLLRQNHLNQVHTGGLSSYAMTLLVVGYLKQREQETGYEMRTDPEDPLLLGRSLLGFMRYLSTPELHSVVSPARSFPIGPAGRRQEFAVRLEDPLDASNDITRGSFNIWYVQQLLFHSLHALGQYTPGGPLPSLMSAFINPRDFSFTSRGELCEELAREASRGD